MKRKRLSRLSTMLELISSDVDVKALVDAVPFNEAELLESAIAQPKLALEAAKLRVQCMHKRAALEAKIALKISLLTQQYRNVRSDGKRAHTEGAVKAYAESKPVVRHLRRKLNIAYAKEELAKGLVDVFRTRKDVLRIIVDMGRISIQAKEYQLLSGNKKLRAAVRHLMRNKIEL